MISRISRGMPLVLTRFHCFFKSQPWWCFPNWYVRHEHCHRTAGSVASSVVNACQSDLLGPDIYPVPVIKLSVPVTYLLSGLRSLYLESPWESAGFSPTNLQEQCLHMTWVGNWHFLWYILSILYLVKVFQSGFSLFLFPGLL